MPNYKGCPFCLEIPDKHARILIVYDGQEWYAHHDCYAAYIEDIRKAVAEIVVQGKW